MSCFLINDLGLTWESHKKSLNCVRRENKIIHHVEIAVCKHRGRNRFHRKLSCHHAQGQYLGYLRRSAGGRSFFETSVGGFIAAKIRKSGCLLTGSTSPLSVKHRLPSAPCREPAKTYCSNDERRSQRKDLQK